MKIEIMINYLRIVNENELIQFQVQLTVTLRLPQSAEVCQRG